MWEVLFFNDGYKWEKYEDGFESLDEALDFITFAESQTGVKGAFCAEKVGDR